MDYLKLLSGLKKEFLEAGRAKYESLHIVLRIIFTIIFIPLRIGFFFGRIGFWFTWFFFKALSAPVDYLQKWLNSQKEGLQHATQAVLYFVCIPVIFTQHVTLAFNAFSFFFQWFGLMIQAYVLTLGAVRWQPVISEAKFDDKETVEEVEVAVAVEVQE
jgi:hypothetical protein